MKYILKAYCISEFGQRKDSQGNPHQEDSVYPSVAQLTDMERTFILCDGMGGHDAGEVASATVCEALGSLISKEYGGEEGIFTHADLEKAIAGAYDALDLKDNGAPKKMGTTMTLLKLHENGATIAHIGDSRVYHIRPGKDGTDTQILYETKDHSLINDLIKVGELTKEEAHFSKQKNIITRVMQPNMDRRSNPDIQDITDIMPGDYFYMCSDGMLEQPEMDNGETIRNIFSEKGGDDSTKVRILTSVTDHNNDNHTAFIIHILDVIDKRVGCGNSNITSKQDLSATQVLEFDRPVISENLKGTTNQEKITIRKDKTRLSKFIIALAAMATIFTLILIFKPNNKEKKLNVEQTHTETPSSPSIESEIITTEEENALEIANEVLEDTHSIPNKSQKNNKLDKPSKYGKESVSQPAENINPTIMPDHNNLVEERAKRRAIESANSVANRSSSTHTEVSVSEESTKGSNNK